MVPSTLRKILFAAVWITMFLVGIRIGTILYSTPVNTLSVSGQRSLSQSHEEYPQKKAPSSLAQTYPQNANINDGLVRVVHVIDGDTIELEGGERIRYIGMDTPETVDPRKPVQCFGLEASRKNKELVEGKRVRLEKDITDRDRYGRLLRYVWVGDVFVNLELVRQGFAHSYSYPPDIAHQDQFRAAEREAREANKGLWSACRAF